MGIKAWAGLALASATRWVHLAPPETIMLDMARLLLVLARLTTWVRLSLAIS